MKKIYILLSFLLIAPIGFAQTNSKAQKADSLFSQKRYAEAIELREEILQSLDDPESDVYKEQLYKKKMAKAKLVDGLQQWLTLVEESLAIFKTMKKQVPEEKIRLNIEYTDILLGTGNLDKALKVIKDIHTFTLAQEKATGKSYKKEITEIISLWANIKWFMQDYAGAIEFYKKALEKAKEIYGYNSLKTANIHQNIATLTTYTGNLNATIDHGEKAVAILEKIRPDNKFLLFQQYNKNFGYYKYYGDLEKLTQLLEKIKTYYRENKNDTSFINTKHNDFPNLNAVKTIYLYTQLQYATATADSAKAERIYDSFQKEIPAAPVSYTPRERSSILSFTLETGSLFHRYGNYKKAKKYYSGALKFSESIGFNFGQLQACLILSTLGVDYQQWDDVVVYSKMAFQNPDFDKFNRPTTFYHNLGYAYFGKKEYEKAAKQLSKVLDHYLTGNTNANYLVVQNLNEMGHVFMEMFRVKHEDKYLEKAYYAYKKSSQLLSRAYRGGHYNDRLSIYQDAVNQGLLQSALMLDQHQREVVELIEMNSSDYLWSNFLKNQKQDLPKDLLALKHQLDSTAAKRDQLTFTLENSPKMSAVKKDSLQTEVEKTKNAFRALQQKIKKNDYAFYQFSRDDFKLENLQNGLKNNEAIIKYIMTDSLVFAYRISKNNLQLEQLAVNAKTLQKTVTGYLDALKNIQPEFREQSQQLYTNLIAPFELKKGAKLTIVKDGVLNYLPFETLLDQNGNYLIQKKPISYSSSLKILGIQKNLREASRESLGIFSPEYNMAFAATTRDTVVKTLVRAGMYKLQGAKEESKKIQKLFEGKIFMSEAATKENFIENAPKYEVLHLAMHAMINNENPEKSNLIFSNNQKLYLPELYEMEIPAQLVVLSACNTGSGKLKQGEGVQSLSRAFTYAGVKSTVMSLWPVPDRETATLMVSFYKNLKDGQTKDGALRNAKLSYLENTEDVALKHPYYWAGFVVNGDVSPVVSDTSIWWYVLIGGVLLFLILFLVKRKNQKSNA